MLENIAQNPLPAIEEEDESNSKAAESQNNVSREIMNKSEVDRLLDQAARSSLNNIDIQRQK